LTVGLFFFPITEHILVRFGIRSVSIKSVVPGEIVVAFIAKLTLYGFWPVERLFAELLSILENRATRCHILSASIAKFSLYQTPYLLFPCRASCSLCQRSSRPTADTKS
jgi:hypothetical protein